MTRAMTTAAALAGLGLAAAGCGPNGGTDSTTGGSDAGSDAGGPGTDAGTDAAPPFVCTEDTLEENDTCGFPALSTTLVNAGPVALGLCDAADYYDLQLAPGATVTVTLTHDPANGDLDLELVNGLTGCVQVWDSSATAGAPVETASYTNNDPSMIFACISVFGHGLADQNNYTLDVMVN